MRRFLAGVFATLTGRETLLNKTISLGSNTVTGTVAQFNTAITDGNIIFSTQFTSSDQTVTASSVLNVAHSLGAVPKLVMVTLKNSTTEANYTVGDEVIIHSDAAPSGSATGPNIVMDATNVTIITGASLSVRDKSTQTDTVITTTSWRYVVRAWV